MKKESGLIRLDEIDKNKLDQINKEVAKIQVPFLKKLEAIVNKYPEENSVELQLAITAFMKSTIMVLCGPQSIDFTIELLHSLNTTKLLNPHLFEPQTKKERNPLVG